MKTHHRRVVGQFENDAHLGANGVGFQPRLCIPSLYGLAIRISLFPSSLERASFSSPIWEQGR